MDTISAANSMSPMWGIGEYLCIFINGIRLDKILSHATNENFDGLLPSWLDFYEDKSRGEKEYVWEKTRNTGKNIIFPILLCPDDFDFSCTVIVVDTTHCIDKVVWNRFGINCAKFPIGKFIPQYIEKSIDWFPNIGPFYFDKKAYWDCVEAFEQASNSNEITSP